MPVKLLLKIRLSVGSFREMRQGNLELFATNSQTPIAGVVPSHLTTLIFVSASRLSVPQRDESCPNIR
jgi:hypothetical protein